MAKIGSLGLELEPGKGLVRGNGFRMFCKPYLIIGEMEVVFESLFSETCVQERRHGRG